MKPDVYVDIEALRAHADRVNEVSAAVQPCVDGLRHMSGHPEIYGLLCSPLILPLVAIFEHVASSAFAAARDNTQRVVQELRTTADGYEEADRYLARLIAGMERS